MLQISKIKISVYQAVKAFGAVRRGGPDIVSRIDSQMAVAL
jgi:hypothetical protein